MIDGFVCNRMPFVFVCIKSFHVIDVDFCGFKTPLARVFVPKEKAPSVACVLRKLAIW